jgi:predicted DNA-binding transcriptional regulator AlpA
MGAEPLRVVGSVATDPPSSTGVVRQLWGWPQIRDATGIPRRTLEREIAAGRFPKPVRYVGRRPYWRVDDVQRWIEGGR